MAAQVTPSKQVSDVDDGSPLLVIQGQLIANTILQQAASAIENFKMESPAKKLDFGTSNKENQTAGIDLKAKWEEVKRQEKQVTQEKQEKPTVAPGIKAEEADEPLLQENPQRFVLFPIKYHEVCDASETRKVVPTLDSNTNTPQ